VTVDTAPQRGTTVSMYLPRYDGPADAPDSARHQSNNALERGSTHGAATTPDQEPAAAAATILLVEDEGAVREMAARTLERAGYTVIAVSRPSEAFAIFQTEQARISLLLTDIVMPEMHGPVLAERLVTQHPDLRVVFVSGYNEIVPGTAGGARMPFLPKPFTAAALIAAVNSALVPTVGAK
jgi:two-component system, cell cycle sensor histidine kinase and response regulator CckA